MLNKKRLFIFLLGLILSAYARPLFAAQKADSHKDLRSIVLAGLPAAKVSVYAIPVGGGKPIVDISSNVPMQPASCTKLITAATALSELGPDYRFRTKFYSDSPPRGGVIDNLYIKGNGDPSITPEAFWRMAGAVLENGIKSIRGDIIIDDSFFSDDNFPHKESGEGHPYEAPTGALAANFNVIEFAIAPIDGPGSPASVVAAPAAPYVKITNHVKTGNITRVYAGKELTKDNETFTLSGEIKAGSGVTMLAKSISRPLMYAGSMFASLLTQHGVEFDGRIREGLVPKEAAHLFDAPSQPLSILVRDMNKWSSNFIAEQIMKHLGQRRSENPGSTAQGLVAVHDWLDSIGIPRGSYQLENASGLSDKTRFTAKQLVKVLVAARSQQAIGPDFEASLSILGIDGTMRQWIGAKELHGILRAKTGTLRSTTALAGFVPNKKGEIVAFAIMGEGLSTGINEAREGELKIVEAIANY